MSEARCRCGRPLVTRTGDLEATCGECRSRPDYCDCEVIASGPRDPLPKEPMTDLGYARRLIHVYGDRLRYVVAWKRWLVWDGGRWAADADGQAQRWMKGIARTVTTALLLANAEKDVVRAAKRAESNHSVSGALSLASTEVETSITPDKLDADPYLLNCRNGVLDLRTLELRDHHPELLLTKMAGADFQPEASSPEFTKFLERVQPDPRMRDYLARLLGHALEGRVTEHVLPIFSGAGANGKSTLISAVLAALGDYGDAADPELLTAKTFDAHPTGTADLFGKRVAVLHETDRGRRLAEATVKRLTGGDRVKARRMREDFWWFEPSHTFVMLTNHRPVVGGADLSIWRRIKLVPWEVEIPAGEQDQALGDRLRLEAPAVLAWLVAGYRDWRERGLADPEQVTAATASYRADSDPLGRFLSERCLTGYGSIGSTELFKAWEQWCAAEGELAGTQTSFSTALVVKGFDKYDSNGRKRWRHLGLAADDQADQ